MGNLKCKVCYITMTTRYSWEVHLWLQTSTWGLSLLTDWSYCLLTFFLSPHRLVLLFADNKATTEVRVSRRTTTCGNHGNIGMVSTGSEIMLCWLDYSKPLKCAREAENSWAECLLLLLHPVQPWIEGFYFRSLPGPGHFQVTSVDCTQRFSH